MSLWNESNKEQSVDKKKRTFIESDGGKPLDPVEHDNIILETLEPLTKKVHLSSCALPSSSTETNTSSLMQPTYSLPKTVDFTSNQYFPNQSVLSNAENNPIHLDISQSQSINNYVSQNSGSNFAINISNTSLWQFPQPSQTNMTENPVVNNQQYKVNESNRNNDSLVLISPTLQFDDGMSCDMSYLLSTPTKSENQVSINTNHIDSLNTPKKDVPEDTTMHQKAFQLSKFLSNEGNSSCLVSHTTPPKRHLAPKPISISKAYRVSPVFKKYRTVSPKMTPTKLKFILPKQRPIKIKRHVLKAKPPKENLIQPLIVDEAEDILATPLPDEVPKEDISEQGLDRNTIDDEDDDILGEEEEDEDDNINAQQEEHLAALFKASSTIAEKHQNERKYNGPQKLNKQQQRLQARIAALNYHENEDENTNFALNFLKRAKDILQNHPVIFNNLIKTLQEFDSSEELPENLYWKIFKTVERYPLIINEFVMFLKPHQAMKVGKYEEYCAGLRLRMFVLKLQCLSDGHLLQTQKLLKLIQILQSKEVSNNSVEYIKAQVAPILRYPHLMESFSQCFSSEPPTQSLNSDFEDIDLDSPGTPDSCEHINLFDDEPQSLPERTCSCECHGSQSLSQAKPTHCRSCSVRFIDGRVYVQIGKTLRPAKVNYLMDIKEDKSKNKNIKSKTVRRQKSSQGNKEVKTY